MIIDRLFVYFDTDKNNFLDLFEFVYGMVSLFTYSFEKLIKIIFKIYDFDSDGLINRDDIKAVLSHIPIHSKAINNIFKFKLENDEFQHRIESQEEIFRYSEKIFGSKFSITEEQYIEIIRNDCSESFVYVL